MDERRGSSTPPDERRAAREDRTRSLRGVATAGAIAALGIFTGLAANKGGADPATHATTSTPATATDGSQSQDRLDQGGTQDLDRGFFDQSGSSGVAPSSGSSGPPTMSGGS